MPPFGEVNSPLHHKLTHYPVSCLALRRRTATHNRAEGNPKAGYALCQKSADFLGEEAWEIIRVGEPIRRASTPRWNRLCRASHSTDGPVKVRPYERGKLLPIHHAFEGKTRRAPTS